MLVVLHVLVQRRQHTQMYNI